MEQEHVGSGKIPADLAAIGAKFVDDGLIEVAHDFPFRCVPNNYSVSLSYYATIREPP
jgi:hypothetical protein